MDFVCFVFAVPGIEYRDSYMQGMYPTTEPHSQPNLEVLQGFLVAVQEWTQEVSQYGSSVSQGRNDGGLIKMMSMRKGYILKIAGYILKIAPT